MDCDWVFLNSDGTKVEATLSEPSIPTPGDGKSHSSKGYVVRYVVTSRASSPNPLTIATECGVQEPPVI